MARLKIVIVEDDAEILARFAALVEAHEPFELCAAVGAPDDYAGEVPVAFVTLNKQGEAKQRATIEAELLVFAMKNVDEKPAKPRSVTVLDVMPLTSVGKVYKPELRRLAVSKN